jgi:hypothetical protein
MRHDPRRSQDYPNWLLPLLLGILIVLGVLGASGMIKLGGQDECEAKGGTYIHMQSGHSTCIEQGELAND